MASLSAGVAMQVVRLAEPVVSMHPRPPILDPVVRAALLIDLALNGILADSPDGIEIDTAPTGFAPADRLLTDVDKHPDKPLAWWLYHAPITVADLADQLVEDGTWVRHGHGPLRRYRAARSGLRTRELRDLDDALRQHTAEDHGSASALLLGLLPLADLPAQFGSARFGRGHSRVHWLLPDLLDNLRRRAAELAAAGRQAQRDNAMTHLV